MECINFYQATGSKCNRAVNDMYRMIDKNNGDKTDFIRYVPGKQSDGADNRISCCVPKDIEDGRRRAFTPGEVALAAEAEKDKKHKINCTLAGYNFLPLCMESGGHWGPQMAKSFKDQIDTYSQESCIPSSILIHYWSARLSMAMQRGIANAVVTRAHFLCRESTVGEGDESGWQDIIEVSDEYNLSGTH